MRKIKLLSEGDDHCVYQLASGQVVRMELNDEWTEIKFKDHKGKGFGEFEFREFEPGTFKLMRMYAEPMKKSGLGRTALEFYKNRTGCRIVVSPNHGQT